jgi:hypothetical protein
MTLESFIETEMDARDFERHPGRPGFWVSRFFALEIRQHRVLSWLRALWPDETACREKLRRKLDSQLARMID